jgi:hypothetical protein
MQTEFINVYEKEARVVNYLLLLLLFRLNNQFNVPPIIPIIRTKIITPIVKVIQACFF